MATEQDIVRTADICDDHRDYDSVRVCETRFWDYGAHLIFHGIIETVATYEDNGEVGEVLKGDGTGKVLVVDGRGSLRHALVGGNVAELAAENGWQGLVVNGCIRDIHEIRLSATGVRAIGTNPRPPKKGAKGGIGQPVTFGGVTFRPGEYLYADEDGVMVAAKPLHG